MNSDGIIMIIRASAQYNNNIMSDLDIIQLFALINYLFNDLIRLIEIWHQKRSHVSHNAGRIQNFLVVCDRDDFCRGFVLRDLAHTFPGLGKS